MLLHLAWMRLIQATRYCTGMTVKVMVWIETQNGTFSFSVGTSISVARATPTDGLFPSSTAMLQPSTQPRCNTLSVKT